MQRRVIFPALISLLSLTQLAKSQDLPVIRANSKNITIYDDGDVLPGELVPRLRPDVYVYHKSRKSKRVSFHTDVDSIAFVVKPGEAYDFVVVMSNGDSCFQRIAGVNPQRVTYSSSGLRLNDKDTIPFTLGPNNAIHIKGKINGSGDLDLIFDTGASLGVLSETGRKKTSIKDGPNNRISFAGVEIDGSPFVQIDYGGRLKADGVVGFNAFEDKVVEINYDLGIMVIHHNDSIGKEGYFETEAVWRQTRMNINAAVTVNGKPVNLLLLFDTGSKWAVSLSKETCRQLALYNQWETIGSQRGRTSDGRTIRSETVLLPKLMFGNLSLSNVPADLETESGDGGLVYNIVGNDVLKRFNVIIDYANGLIYLKPNSLTGVPYNRPFNKLWILVPVVAVLLAVFWVVRRRHLKRRV